MNCFCEKIAQIQSDCMGTGPVLVKPIILGLLWYLF